MVRNTLPPPSRTINKQVRFVKRETKSWGLVWQTVGNYPLQLGDIIQSKIWGVLKPTQWFTYEGDWKNRYADRRLSFKLQYETDEVMLQFYANMGAFDLTDEDLKRYAWL